MKIVCIGYRSWALNIYYKLSKEFSHDFIIINKTKKILEKDIIKHNPDLLLFYGWSWAVSKALTKKYKCLMLHPSDLPKYRGGSPIQNQIINGITKSKITIFIMNENMDEGDIVLQTSLDLSGTIEDIFKRIEERGYELTKKILVHGISKTKKQKKNNISFFKRRSPEDSEITIQELIEKDSNYLYNKIRMLGDPYPNAYIKTSDNKKLLIKSAIIED